MEKEITPSESLSLITNVILEAKTRFRDNGFSFIFLGLCMFVSGIGQFILLEMEYYSVNYFPYFIMPVAGVITFFYYKKKRRVAKSKNIFAALFSVLGIVLGINLTVSGFFFWSRFGMALIPYMLILFSVWPVLSGVLLRSRMILLSGILINIIAYCSFFIDREYHPLILSLVALLGIVLPGIIFNHSEKEKES
jgi:hypothetical protein